MTRRIDFEDLICHLIDGDSVDWAAARAAARNSEESHRLDALQVLARIRDANAQHPSEPTTGLPFPRWRHLRLIDRIGQGQHGDLYRAWDESLQLLVALKLLAEGAPPGTQAMLLNEARLLAQVRHDNVVRVHGADLDQGRVGYWMEFVDGANLDPPASRTPLAAVSVGLEIARALAAIHEAGVVHGDVKPANILCTASGRTVLVDFSVSSTPTNGDAVRPWVAGTPFYMAPELLLHRAASAPADVYALGILIFHLATGTYPMDAPDLDALRASHAGRGDRRLVLPGHRLPSQLAEFLNLCLSADPRQRPNSRAAVQRLEHIAAALDPRARKRRWTVAALVGAGLALAVAGTAALEHVRTRARSDGFPPQPKFGIQQLTSTGTVDDAAISRDGTQVAYAQSNSVYRMLLSTRTTTALIEGSENGVPDVAFSPDVSFSPNGAWVYYQRRVGYLSELCRVPAEGGPSQMLYPDIWSTPSFSPDGQKMVLSRTLTEGAVTTDLFLASADGRDSLRLLRREEGLLPYTPCWSPDGATIAMLVRKAGAHSARLALMPSAGGPLREIGPDYGVQNWPTCWWDSASTGVYIALDAINYTRIRDGATRRITGEFPEYTRFRASADGRRLVAMRLQPHANLWRVPVGGSAVENSSRATRLTAVSGLAIRPDVARRGGAIAFTSNTSGSMHVWVLDRGSTRPRQITHGPGTDRWSRWSPDGTRIAFASQRGDSTHIFVIGADGTNERQLTHLRLCAYPVWSPDGCCIDFSAGEQVHTIYRVPADGGPSVPLRAGCSKPNWSPDGNRLLCFTSDDDSLYFTMFQTDSLRAWSENKALRVSDTPDIAWHPDGRRFTTLAPSSMENLANRRLDGTLEPPFTAFTDGIRMLSWCWEPGGSAIVCTRGGTSRDAFLFEAAASEVASRGAP